MRRNVTITLFVGIALLVGAGTAFAHGNQEKSSSASAGASAATPTVVAQYWTTWCTNNKYYSPSWSKLAQQFNSTQSGVDFSINVDCIPYNGYSAKYQSAFQAHHGPDMFQGMTDVWQGQYQQDAPMPADLAQKFDKIILPVSKAYGTYGGKRYGIPQEGGNFQMMYINVKMFKAAGLNPNDPPTTYDQLLTDAKKLTKYGPNGEIKQAGFAVRYKGNEFGIADKSQPFFNAWGALWLNWEKKTASGYLDSPEAIQALTFYGNLVTKWKVSSLKIGNPADAFGQGRAAIMFRESWYAGWLDQHAPNIEYKVYPLPSEKQPSGYTNNFPWAIQVNKDAPQMTQEWVWKFLDWYASNTSVRRAQYEQAKILPPYTDLMNDPVFTKLPDYAAWKKMATGRAAPTYYIPPAHEVLLAIGHAITSVFYQNATPKQALTQATNKVNDILSQYK